jgi:hypothetical protein
VLAQRGHEGISPDGDGPNVRGTGPDAAASADVSGAGPSIGRRTVNRVRPGALSTLILPPWFSMMRAEMLKPNPVPSPFGFVVKKGSKMRGRTSAGIPGPLSSIATST